MRQVKKVTSYFDLSFTGTMRKPKSFVVVFLSA